MDHRVFQLPNGVRILFKPADSPIAHACVLVNAGSRDELPGKAGLAHFIEHMLFKRTEKRSTSQILNRLELVGADLNAYTTREYTCIHASFMQPYLERSLDLFADILFHSVFPEDELEKEKGVVIDEIHSYRDQPEDAVNDDFEELLFKGHALGNNILGEPETVSEFTRTDIGNFLEKNYGADHLVIGVTGKYSEKQLLKICEKLFGTVQHVSPPVRPRGRVEDMEPVRQRFKKPVSQAHYVTGGRAYDLYHKNRIPFLLLNNLLGGTGMSSRLNLEIREKAGIAYTIESGYSPLTDTGIFSIYLGTDAEKLDRAEKILNRELRKLRDTKLGTVQLHQAKQRFTGQIALGEENRMGLVIGMCKSLMDYNQVDTLEEVVQKVNAAEAGNLLEIANEMLDPARFSSLLFLPD